MNLPCSATYKPLGMSISSSNTNLTFLPCLLAPVTFISELSASPATWYSSSQAFAWITSAFGTATPFLPTRALLHFNTWKSPLPGSLPRLRPYKPSLTLKWSSLDLYISPYQECGPRRWSRLSTCRYSRGLLFQSSYITSRTFLNFFKRIISFNLSLLT